MPGFGTTDRTYRNAIDLMQSLGVTIRESQHRQSVTQHFEDIGHDISVHDVTYENAQARERTQILMDLANELGGMVIGTGDLSELALGWATYNGDHMSMYGVNASIPKTLIKYLVRFVSQQVDEQSALTLTDIIDTPISPELIPPTGRANITQKTEDSWDPTSCTTSSFIISCATASVPSRSTCWPEGLRRETGTDERVQVPIQMPPSCAGSRPSALASSPSSSSAAVCPTVRRWAR
jgi:NH3-dependent NAD+ synthetase